MVNSNSCGGVLAVLPHGGIGTQHTQAFHAVVLVVIAFAVDEALKPCTLLPSQTVKSLGKWTGTPMTCNTASSTTSQHSTTQHGVRPHTHTFQRLTLRPVRGSRRSDVYCKSPWKFCMTSCSVMRPWETWNTDNTQCSYPVRMQLSEHQQRSAVRVSSSFQPELQAATQSPLKMHTPEV